MAGSGERGRYRIEYPSTGAPSFVVGERELTVIDCSESGLRYALPTGPPPPQVGDVVSGFVRFPEGEEIPVEGAVARVYGRSAAVNFSGVGIPFGTILQEQHRLRRKYLGHLGGRGG